MSFSLSHVQSWKYRTAHMIVRDPAGSRGAACILSKGVAFGAQRSTHTNDPCRRQVRPTSFRCIHSSFKAARIRSYCSAVISPSTNRLLSIANAASGCATRMPAAGGWASPRCFILLRQPRGVKAPMTTPKPDPINTNHSMDTRNFSWPNARFAAIEPTNMTSQTTSRTPATIQESTPTVALPTDDGACGGLDDAGVSA